MELEADSKGKLLQEIRNGNMQILDERNSESMYMCLVCLVNISGHMQAQSHAVGSKHAKKLKQKPVGEIGSMTPAKKICLENANNSLYEESRTAAASVGGKELFCSICQVEFSGYCPMQQHMEGKSHARKLKSLESMKALNISSSNSVSSSQSSTPMRETLTNRRGDPAFVSSSEIESSELTNREDVSQAKKSGTAAAAAAAAPLGENFFCSVCRVEFTGYCPMQQHMEGKSHARKLKSLESMRMVLNNSDSSSRSSSRSSTPISETLATRWSDSTFLPSSEMESSRLLKILDLQNKLNLEDVSKTKINNDLEGLQIIGVDEPIPQLF